LAICFFHIYRFILHQIDIVKNYKEKGNEHYKAGFYKKACVSYSTAIAYTKGLPGRTGGLDGMSQTGGDASIFVQADLV
jgi:hypothetical protein